MNWEKFTLSFAEKNSRYPLVREKTKEEERGEDKKMKSREQAKKLS